MKQIKQSTREGLYVSDIIGDRYQVLESDIIRGSYIVFDLKSEDILRSKDGSTVYFDTMDAATNVANGAVAPLTKTKRTKSVTRDIKKPRVSSESDSKKNTSAKPKKGSANGMIIELLKTTSMTDDEISAEVSKSYPDCKTCKPYDVKYRRRKVEAGAL